MSSIFNKIIDKEIEAYIIDEDENNIAFLDVRPVKFGHTLCVPKKNVDKLFSLDMEDYLSLEKFTYKIANALEKAVPCKRIGVMVLGLEVPHAHIHLIPVDSEKDLSFANPRLTLDPEKSKKLVEEIKKYL